MSHQWQKSFKYISCLTGQTSQTIPELNLQKIKLPALMPVEYSEMLFQKVKKQSLTALVL